ncbi:IAH1 [Candida margitis]|uniref:IAH1 n=1 Tax=Candida margitis TaxID=1775924 RepID=UPI00222681C0|nr:IAH1 [Candida margitis]KAI5963938.1 IAH1 [Candida margitis]
MNIDKLILFGDSITQYSNQIVDGFALQPELQDLYIRRLDILNRGFSGYNSEHARLILPKILEAELNESKNNVKVMTIFFGTNDGFVGINSIQPVELPRYKENIAFLVKLALENNVKPIVVGPSLHDPKIGAECFEYLQEQEAVTCERYLHYSEAAKSVCLEFKVPFIDLWEGFRKDGGWTKEQLFAIRKDSPHGEVPSLGAYLCDGIHFTSRAYKILFRAIVKAIEQNYPEYLPQNLPYKLAYWRDIDHTDLDSIFKEKEGKDSIY